MVLPLAAVALLQARPWTEEAVLRAERVLVGTVERVLEESGPDGAARTSHRVLVRVDTIFVGPEDLHEFQVIDGGPDIEAGSEALLFLKATDVKSATEGRQAPHLETWAIGEELQRVEGVPWLLPAGFVSECRSAGLPLDAPSLRKRVEDAVDCVLPRLEATFTSGGILGSWFLRMGARGELQVQGESRELAPDAARSLWRSIEALDLDRLPREVRCFGWIDGAERTVELRTRRGVHFLRFQDGAPIQDASAEQRDAFERFAALWELLPGPGKPKVVHRLPR